MSSMVQSTIAFIPVRGGSKSIPLKNIKHIAGKPLVQWTIEAAAAANGIDMVYVSTDSDDIRRVVEALGLNNVEVVDRSEATATDEASTESAMLEFAEAHDFEHMILIQATSPLLQTTHLEEGIIAYKSAAADALLSVVRQKRFIWETVDAEAKPVNFDPKKRPRRQEWEGFFVENGAFYITSRDALLDSKCRMSGKKVLYEMPEETYFEIDEPSDWIIIEELLKRIHGN